MNTAQGALLKQYLTANPDAIPGLSAHLTAGEYEAVADLLNVTTVGKSVRRDSVDGQQLKFAMFTEPNFFGHPMKADFCLMVPSQAFSVSDVAYQAMTGILSGVGDEETNAPILEKLEEVLTKSPCTLGQFACQDSDIALTTNDVSNAWQTDYS